jgi:hypothetical protein
VAALPFVEGALLVDRWLLVVGGLLSAVIRQLFGWRFGGARRYPVLNGIADGRLQMAD